MSTAMRMGVKRVAASVARPAQSRRAMSDGSRLAENRKIFQANPHLHGETMTFVYTELCLLAV